MVTELRKQSMAWTETDYSKMAKQQPTIHCNFQVLTTNHLMINIHPNLRKLRITHTKNVPPTIPCTRREMDMGHSHDDVFPLQEPECFEASYCIRYFFSFVKNRSCVTRICITKIATKCILVDVVKWRHHANVLLSRWPNGLASRRKSS